MPREKAQVFQPIDSQHPHETTSRVRERILSENAPQSNTHAAYENWEFCAVRKMDTSVYTEGGAREEEGMMNEGVIVAGFSCSIPRKDKIGGATTTSSPA